MGPKCTLWKDAIEKELKKVKVAWERRDDISVQDAWQGKALKGYKEITVHMIFDIKRPAYVAPTQVLMSAAYRAKIFYIRQF